MVPTVVLLLGHFQLKRPYPSRLPLVVLTCCCHRYCSRYLKMRKTNLFVSVSCFCHLCLQGGVDTVEPGPPDSLQCRHPPPPDPHLVHQASQTVSGPGSFSCEVVQLACPVPRKLGECEPARDRPGISRVRVIYMTFNKQVKRSFTNTSRRNFMRFEFS